MAFNLIELGKSFFTGTVVACDPQDSRSSNAVYVGRLYADDYTFYAQMNKSHVVSLVLVHAAQGGFVEPEKLVGKVRQISDYGALLSRECYEVNHIGQGGKDKLNADWMVSHIKMPLQHQNPINERGNGLAAMGGCALENTMEVYVSTDDTGHVISVGLYI
ncbi:MAG: hypothetical protein SOW30_10165 [Parabacteroides sp.]|nr:hypothetical protein [Parabacteroides sp.]